MKPLNTLNVQLRFNSNKLNVPLYELPPSVFSTTYKLKLVQDRQQTLSNKTALTGSHNFIHAN